MAQCSSADYKATLTFAQNVCGSVGISLNLGSTNNNAASAAAAPEAPTTAATAATSGDSGDDEVGDSASSMPATAASSSYAPSAASTSSTAVSASSAVNNGFVSLYIPGVPTPSLLLVAQSYTIPQLSDTDGPSPSTQIATTTACTNGTSKNTTVATSAPVPFEGAAATHRLQWASAALMIGAVGAFVTL